MRGGVAVLRLLFWRFLRFPVETECGSFCDPAMSKGHQSQGTSGRHRPVKTLGSSGDSVNSAANTLRYPQLQHFHWPGQSERLLLVAKGISCCFACKGLLSGRFMLRAAAMALCSPCLSGSPLGCWVLPLDRGHLAWLLCSWITPGNAQGTLCDTRD